MPTNSRSEKVATHDVWSPALSTVASAFSGSGGRNMLVATVLAASFVSGDTLVNLLLGDSSIGESDTRLRGKVVGYIIGVVR